MLGHKYGKLVVYSLLFYNVAVIFKEFKGGLRCAMQAGSACVYNPSNL